MKSRLLPLVVLIIQIQIGAATYQVTLENNRATQKLVENLPLILNMQDLYGNEKYVNLPLTLPTDSQGVKMVKRGDLMLFGSDCLVLFYHDFSTPYHYTKIGRLENPENLPKTLGNRDIQIKLTK